MAACSYAVRDDFTWETGTKITTVISISSACGRLAWAEHHETTTISQTLGEPVKRSGKKCARKQVQHRAPKKSVQVRGATVRRASW